ncbi:hypothetical protein FOA52_015153 [Chlamydomonas sp. UWO 241]|nr:hypothetical protein FOA52_015153 [Chlamydomonas sp. UWO 241]
MMMQFAQYKNENQAHVQQLMEEDNHEMQATIAMLPNLNCDDVAAGLRKLGSNFDQVADADMDAMFSQVRTEERTGARELLGGIVQQAKGAVGAQAAPALQSAASPYQHPNA